MDGRTDGQKDGHGQTYIPPPLAGENEMQSKLLLREKCDFLKPIIHPQIV